jgi:non-heme Fe2+,alpha-ketoglutarate-dependent halogenase
MPKNLTEQQITQYRADGFLHPFEAFSSEEAAKFRDHVDAYEQHIGGSAMGFKGKYRANPHLLCPWADQFVRLPSIVDLVEDLIGSNILLFSSRFFIKEPHSPENAAWHQDAPYIGLKPYDAVYAWIALSDVPLESGPLELLKGSHLRGFLAHKANMVEHSLTASGQAIVDKIDLSERETVVLKAGQYSFHHTCCAHQSGANDADIRRIGIALNYIPTHVRHYGPGPMPATLIRGEDTYGHFDKMPTPKQDFDDDAVACHGKAFKIWNENYFEQMRRADAEETPSSPKLTATV